MEKKGSKANGILDQVLEQDSENNDGAGKDKQESPKNFLEESISMLERTSLKLYPVVKEVIKRLITET
jgi:hypothetical protein